MKNIIILALSLVFSFNSYAIDNNANYDTLKKGASSFDDLIFQSEEGKTRSEAWGDIKMGGLAFAKSWKHQTKLKLDKNYAVCYQFTNTHADLLKSKPDQLKMVARDSANNSALHFKNLFDIANATFMVYIDGYEGYDKEKYEFTFVEFFMNADSFDGLCTDELFKNNISEIVQAYNHAYETEASLSN